MRIFLGVAKHHLGLHHGFLHGLIDVIIRVRILIFGALPYGVIDLGRGSDAFVFGNGSSDLQQFLRVVSEIEILIGIHFEPINSSRLGIFDLSSIVVLSFIFIFVFIRILFLGLAILDIIIENNLFIFIHEQLYLSLLFLFCQLQCFGLVHEVFKAIVVLVVKLSSRRINLSFCLHILAVVQDREFELIVRIVSLQHLASCIKSRSCKIKGINMREPIFVELSVLKVVHGIFLVQLLDAKQLIRVDHLVLISVSRIEHELAALEELLNLVVFIVNCLHLK